jgi:hypothetical protein
VCRDQGAEDGGGGGGGRGGGEREGRGNGLEMREGAESRVGGDEEGMDGRCGWQARNEGRVGGREGRTVGARGRRWSVCVARVRVMEIEVDTESCWSHVPRIHGSRRVDDDDEEADDAAPYRHGRVDALLILSRAFGSRPLRPEDCWWVFVVRRCVRVGGGWWGEGGTVCGSGDEGGSEGSWMCWSCGKW